MRFVGLSISSKIPDAKTIWLFKEQLRIHNVHKELFNMFYNYLEATGYIAHDGNIVDATFVEVPKQHNNKKENDAIKNGEIPEEWLDPDNKNKLAQKDTDARWAKKNDELHYGYKDHVSVDSKSKLIKDYEVTDAAVHDSNKCVEFIDKKDKAFYADSAYYCEKISSQIPVSMDNCILEKATRNHPLTSEQKQSNKERSRIRCRIEHVFGTMERQLGGIEIRCIGIERAKLQICMKNFIYNIVRYTFLRKASI